MGFSPENGASFEFGFIGLIVFIVFDKLFNYNQQVF